MNSSLLFRTEAWILCGLLFVACVLMVRLGRFIRVRLLHKDDQESKGGVNSLMGALFGLWGFVLAFTFGSSASRFENVRALMVDEGNAMRTAILRSQAFPDTIGNDLRKDLKAYLETRIATYENTTDAGSLSRARQDAEDIGTKVWAKTIQASSLPDLGAPAGNMLGSLVSLFDIGARKDAVLLSGVPDLIIWMLFFLALVISFIGGFTTPVIRSKEWVVIIGFITLAIVVVYITMDLGRPLRGFIKPDVGQDRLVRLRGML